MRVYLPIGLEVLAGVLCGSTAESVPARTGGSVRRLLVRGPQRLPRPYRVCAQCVEVTDISMIGLCDAEVASVGLAS